MKNKSMKLNNILLEIIEKKKRDLIAQMQDLPLEELEARIRNSVFGENIFKKNIVSAKNIALIAEIKFASPVNPHLGSQKMLFGLVKKYENAGVDAISIITEKHFFKGSPEFVSKIRTQVNPPVIQKDFVIDAYQIYEAKVIGSEALLLIARILNQKALISFVSICKKLDIEPVVEINDEDDLKKAVATTTNIIAVNARNLENFEIDVDKACNLIGKIPDKFIKLGFSGINSAKEVEKYKLAGARGVLVGTSLMKAKNIEDFILSLRVKEKVKVKICGVRNLKSAKVAIVAGADFLGFNFVPTSKRYVSPKDANKIIKQIKGRVKVVGVFQNASIDEVNNISETVGLDFVQLHGEEDKEYMKKIKNKIIKKIDSDSRFLTDDIFQYLLIDRRVQGRGEMVDLRKAKEISKQLPIFFSGGLTVKNVSEVVQKVKPFAVDVAGGVETDGKQDLKKIRMFIQNAKGALL